MNDKTKKRIYFLLSGILCLTMTILTSAPVSSGGAAKPLPLFLLECLALFFVIRFLLDAAVRIFSSMEMTFAFLFFFLGGILWAPALASPFLGMDTLTVFRLEEPFSIFCAEGRPVTGAILTALKDFGWFTPSSLKICMTSGIFLLAMAMTFLWESCVRQTRRNTACDKTLLGLGIGAVFFAPLMVVVQAFPILMLPWFAGLSALIFAVVLLMNGKGWKIWLSAFLLLCLCTNTYPTFAGFFIPLALLCAASPQGAVGDNGNLRWKEFIFFFAGLCGTTLAALGTSFLCAKWLSPLLGNANVRAVGSIDIPANILTILHSLRPVYMDLFGIFFPGFLPIAILAAAGVILFYAPWRIRRFQLILLMMLSLAMLFCTSILLQLFVSEVWINDRASIPCSASAGLAAFTILFFLQGRRLLSGLPENGRPSLMAAATLSTNIRITVRMHESEMADYYEAREFLRKVETHEKKNRATVEAIELHFRPRYSTRNRPGNYPCPDISRKLEQDTKLFCTPWKIQPYFEHFFNRRFLVKRNPVNAPGTLLRWEDGKHREDSDYDGQMVFEGNTVHLLND